MYATKRLRSEADKAAHLHPFFFFTIYGTKLKIQYITNQACRLISMVLYTACLVQVFMMAPQIPPLIHALLMAVLFAVIVTIGNQMNVSATVRAKFRRVERMKKRGVTYTRFTKGEWANVNKR